MDQQLAAQALGFLSFVLGIYAFYQKDDRKLKIIMVIFNLNHLIHFILLGAVVSALSTLLSAIRTVTAIYVSSVRVAAVFILIGLSSAVYLGDSLYELWSILGMSIGTYAVFVLKGIPMRIAFLLGAICWLINNIIVGSIGGILLEATLISVNIITIIRLLREHSQSARLK